MSELKRILETSSIPIDRISKDTGYSVEIINSYAQDPSIMTPEFLDAVSKCLCNIFLENIKNNY